MQEEIWKPIRFFENYEVSNLGNIRNTNYHRTGKCRLLRPVLCRISNAYNVKLCHKGVVYNKSIKYLVADAFMQYNGLGCLAHINGNIKDNRVSNLEFRKKPNNGCKTTFQYDLKGNLIRVWESAKNASKSLNLAYNKVTQCCVGELESVNGFVFKYK